MNPKELQSYSARIIKDLNDAIMVSRMSHWNVRGTDFYGSHLLFGRIYDDLSGLMDGLIETLRAFQYSPGFEEFSGPGIALDSDNCKELAALILDFSVSLMASLTLFLEKIDKLEPDPRFPALENHIQNLSDKTLSVQYLLQAFLGL
jgi:hypothetical protein